jgi:CSLREA domain-containing protein
MINPASLSFRLFVVAALTLLAALAFASLRPTSGAGPLVVSKTADTADGACDITDCSLREAIIAANAAPGADTITLPAGTYTLTIGGTGEDGAATGDLDIAGGASGALTINGAGAPTTIIHGDGLDRVFQVQSDATVSMSGVTIENGSGTNVGAGIFSSGALTIDRSTIRGNNAITNNGGGILNQGPLTITNSTISGNTAGSNGGGIYNAFDGSVTLTNSTVSGNTAALSAGGIYNSGPGATSLTNVTVSGNSAGAAGGIRKDSGSITLQNTIVANSTSGDNCLGGITSNGHNLDSGTSCALAGGGDLSSTDPLLGPLALNAPGTTRTHALLPGSPAVDAGANAGCPATDQRGVARPLGVACDIGAYEVDPRGDTNCDGLINGLDLLDVLSDVGDVGTPAACHANGDVDRDGHITTTDALLIAQYWAGVITSFPSHAN